MNFKYPLPQVIKPHFEKFKNIEGYFLEDDRELKFFATHPNNTDITDILLKIEEVRDHDLLALEAQDAMAQHIASLDIDPKLRDGSMEVINSIASLDFRGEKRNFYAFATRYCNYHRPDYYPIYDPVLEKLFTWYYQQVEGKPFDPQQLLDYPKFKELMQGFIDDLEVTPFSFRELDKFLWVYGRKVLNDFTRLNGLEPVG